MVTYEATARAAGAPDHVRPLAPPAPAPATARWRAPDDLRYASGQRHLKRVVDVVLAMFAIVVASPVLLGVAAAVVATSPGPAVYGQWRIGRDGAPFRCWKFRTMYLDAESRLRADRDLWEAYVDNDFKLETGRDPRVTPLGRFLRHTSLDELPQLCNVLFGTMSLVGPRPVVPEELDRYGPWEPAYLVAKPGITGPWQCGGRNTIKYPLRAQLDATYVETWSLWRDFVILARTVPAVLRQDGSD